ncbi:hypothetical protein FBY31_4331 [Arthrobacter sp. SLBN-100]|uniref:hypothetical protein n=1 Tax=Arthrobacter sp. SLBN-100 TaxID=2768450 RepID=UPI00114E6B24|nr:hypothetical protein [Arthrobacter sp. SLBN-100]TQJ61962.1 hypothetical protein FBY31_4331 [Arthrobacter sp. SLBN-100]
MSTIYVRARNAWDAQEQLNAAEGRLQLQGMRIRTHGILATEISAGHFAVALTERFPCGFTHVESVNPPLEEAVRRAFRNVPP